MPANDALQPTSASRFESCPGCSAVFLPHDGPTHAYIGAHPGCWALYSAVITTGAPPVDLLRSSRVDARPAAPTLPSRNLAPLLVDAYAAQHHGVPSPRAIQSVAVHLLVLYGIISRGLAIDRALWIRRRALRIRGVYRWLEPPQRESALALRHLWGSDAHQRLFSPTAYVASVFDAWHASHHVAIADWFVRYVDADDPAARAL